MPYTKVHEAWANRPSMTTAINAAALDQIEDGIATAQAEAEVKSTVYFGADPNKVRPSTTSPVVWIGNTGVVPVNAIENDLIFTSDPVPDTTAPTPGTVAGSAITSSGFTLTISGASDETALHATAYAFSTDNGATWSAFQASNALAVTGKSPSTGYQCKGRVRDAAGNTADTAAVTVTTSAAGSGLTYQNSAIDTADLSTYTFASLAIGTAAADRRVVAAIDWSGASALTLSSLTIGGVTATVDVDSGAITGNRRVILASAIVPTGTTADVVLTLSGAGTRAGIAWWTGAVDPTGQTDISIDLASDTLSLTTTAGQTVICAGHATDDTTGAAVNTTWTGATERYDQQYENTNFTHTGADVVASGALTEVSYSVGAGIERRGYVAAVYA